MATEHDPSSPPSHPSVVLHDRVELYDTDASGLIFYGAATRWATAAQFRLFQSLGHRVDFAAGTTTPVRAAAFEYLGPLHLGDEISLTAWIDEVGRTSLTVVIEVRTSGDGTLRVRAKLSHVHVRLADMTPISVPAHLASAARSERRPGP
jgi:YbgC/YbaW family acyl-CoA thioester hydrolase